MENVLRDYIAAHGINLSTDASPQLIEVIHMFDAERTAEFEQMFELMKQTIPEKSEQRCEKCADHYWGKPSEVKINIENLVGKTIMSTENNHDIDIANMIQKTLLNVINNAKSPFDNETSKEYDAINPEYYKRYSVEAIDMLRRIYGKESTALYCEMTAFKYRMRMGSKPNNPLQQDLQKEEWLLNKAKELRCITS